MRAGRRPKMAGMFLVSVCFSVLFMGGWLGPLIPYCMSHQMGNVHSLCLHLHKAFASFLMCGVMVRRGGWNCLV